MPGRLSTTSVSPPQDERGLLTGSGWLACFVGVSGRARRGRRARGREGIIGPVRVRPLNKRAVRSIPKHPPSLFPPIKHISCLPLLSFPGHLIPLAALPKDQSLNTITAALRPSSTTPSITMKSFIFAAGTLIAAAYAQDDVSSASVSSQFQSPLSCASG